MNKKSILVTGGTGSFGKAFVNLTLKHFNPAKVVVYSRDEMKQWEMAQHYRGDSRIRFFVGDIRDRTRLSRATVDTDIIVHAAAMKIVPTAEYNPSECVATNIHGTENVVNAAIECGVKKVIGLSTDKACSPSNLYGATKLVSDRVLIASNHYGAPNGPRFSVVRYGNVMGSRGSVIPLFHRLREGGSLPITDLRMTRFLITIEQGVRFVWSALSDMLGGEIYVKKLPSVKIVELARAIAPEAKHEIIGLRPGEKIHEEMISVGDSRYTYEYSDYYKLLPPLNNWDVTSDRIKGGTLVPDDFSYSSDRNKDWMSTAQIAAWINDNRYMLDGLK